MIEWRVWTCQWMEKNIWGGESNDYVVREEFGIGPIAARTLQNELAEPSQQVGGQEVQEQQLSSGSH